MNSTDGLPLIFGYNDYKKFLIDYQAARQKIDPTFSKSEFSRSLQLPNTRSFLNDVLKGKKLTPTFIERFIHVIGFDTAEANYFRILVKHNQCDIPSERQMYFEQLISLNRTPRTFLDKQTLKYYSRWYNSTIRALLHIINISDDFTPLVKSIFPPITKKEVKESINLLISLNLIQKNEDGFLKPTDRSISAPEFVKDEMVRQYQLACLDLARNAICNSSGKPQRISTNTISVSEEGFKLILKSEEKFRSEVRAIAHKDEFPADRVYQVCLQIFPMNI